MLKIRLNITFLVILSGSIGQNLNKRSRSRLYRKAILHSMIKMIVLITKTIRKVEKIVLFCYILAKTKFLQERKW